MVRRHELTDSQWDAIKGLIPGKSGDPGRTGRDNRLFVNAVIYVAQTGIAWADFPTRFGNWNSVWRRFRRWSANGIWQKLLSVLGAPGLEEIQLDSTTIKAHPVASGSRKLAHEKKDDADHRRCLGRSRGGLTSQMHVAVNEVGRLVRMILTAGQSGGPVQAQALIVCLKSHFPQSPASSWGLRWRSMRWIMQRRIMASLFGTSSS